MNDLTQSQKPGVTLEDPGSFFETFVLPLSSEATIKGLMRQLALVLHHLLETEASYIAHLEKKDGRFAVKSLQKMNASFPDRPELKLWILQNLNTTIFSHEGILLFPRDDKLWILCALGDLGLHEVHLLLLSVKKTVTEDSEEFLAADRMVRLAQNLSRTLSRVETTSSLLYRDDLTGLHNHRYLDIALQAEGRRFQRYGTPFSILFLDLDGFKNVNDKYGHMVGSQILKSVGTIIKEAVRDVDVVIRFGGDEFVALLTGATSTSAVFVAERIKQRIADQSFFADGQHVACKLSVSIGLASCPEHGKTPEELLNQADKSMYESKRSGKNRISIFKARPIQES